MAEFQSASEFREVMDRAFTLMSTDPQMGPKLRDAQVPQRFEFPDQDAVVNITHDEEGAGTTCAGSGRTTSRGSPRW